MGASSNTPPAETQQQRRHHLVHCDGANAGTENMSLNAQSKIVNGTGSSKNQNMHGIGCEYSCLEVDSYLLTIYYTAGAHQELRDQFIAACNGKRPLSTKACVPAVCKIEGHDVVSFEIVANESSDTRPQ